MVPFVCVCVCKTELITCFDFLPKLPCTRLKVTCTQNSQHSSSTASTAVESYCKISVYWKSHDPTTNVSWHFCIFKISTRSKRPSPSYLETWVNKIACTALVNLCIIICKRHNWKWELLISSWGDLEYS